LMAYGFMFAPVGLIVFAIGLLVLLGGVFGWSMEDPDHPMGDGHHDEHSDDEHSGDGHSGDGEAGQESETDEAMADDAVTDDDSTEDA